jgi:hypothetical protein
VQFVGAAETSDRTFCFVSSFPRGIEEDLVTLFVFELLARRKCESSQCLDIER